MQLINDSLTINGKYFKMQLDIDKYIDMLEDVEIRKPYNTTGKNMAMPKEICGLENLIVEDFFKQFLEKNIIPNPDIFIKDFLKNYLTPDSFPLAQKEYVTIADSDDEIKLSYLMAKFYRIYINILKTLYDFLYLLSFKDDIMTLESNFLTPIKLTVSDHTYKFCRYENSEKIVNINEYEAEEDIGDFILQGAEIYEEIINKIKEETTNE